MIFNNFRPVILDRKSGPIGHVRDDPPKRMPWTNAEGCWNTGMLELWVQKDEIFHGNLS
jgi:hypothetical protein